MYNILSLNIFNRLMNKNFTNQIEERIKNEFNVIKETIKQLFYSVKLDFTLLFNYKHLC